ncbi:MAG: hypothetical protein H7331_03675 [Bacteroidia bacterium]|nr:hypothetical protein [Bacteroidia bacterium]
MKHNIELAMLGLQQYIIETFGEESIIKSTNIHAQHSPPLALSGAEVVEGCLQDGVVFNTLGKVYINDTQYFDNVPQVAWEFYIGGYQPAQKWLKDRKHRTLEFDDILHYQKIIVALTNTHRLMQAIDTIAIE